MTERNAFIATKVAPPARSRPSTIPAARASSSVGHVKKAPLPTPALATSLHVEKGKLLTGLLGRQDRRLSRKQLHLRSAKVAQQYVISLPSPMLMTNVGLPSPPRPETGTVDEGHTKR